MALQQKLANGGGLVRSVEDAAGREPPTELTLEPERFYKGEGDMVPLHDEKCGEKTSALDRLGSSPLPKTGFPFIGFLSGVYEHVSAMARGEGATPE